MRKLILLLVALTAAAGFIPAPVAAQEAPDELVCDNTIRVFSFYATSDTTLSPSSVDTKAACLVITESDGIDPRLIYPGAGALSITADLNPDGEAEPISGTLTHANGTVTELTLTPAPFIDGSCCRFRAQTVFIDPTAMGYYRVAVDFPAGVDADGRPIIQTFTTTYRTLGTPSDKPGYIP